MNRPGSLWKVLALVALLLVVAVPGAARTALASADDVALFHDELAQYGTWTTFGNYGEVWYPTTVSENWRPYMDGRWQPTDDGWVFESGEPWAWATYHFGNWMPTTEFGWVWVPGSTWYPSTVAWRSSSESGGATASNVQYEGGPPAGQDQGYVGWAPIPPPNYVPEPAYQPAGYYPGMPLLDLLSLPFWIFAGATNLLLGWGLPYGPSYSYYNCGCLAPFGYYPWIWPRTFWWGDFYNPFWAPGGFFFFGPPFPFVINVFGFDRDDFHRRVRDFDDFRRFRGVVPHDRLLARNERLRNAIPKDVREGRKFEINKAANKEAARRSLNRPDVVKAPAGAAAARKGAPEVMKGAKAGAPAGTFRGRGRNLPPESVRGTKEMQQHVGAQRGREMRTTSPAERSRRMQQEQMLRQHEMQRQQHFRQPSTAPRGGGMPKGGGGGAVPHGGGGAVPHGGGGGVAPGGGGGGHMGR